MQKTVLTHLWKRAKLFLLIVVASLLGAILAGYPNSPQDPFLGKLVHDRSAGRGAKLALHKRWRPFNPLEAKKQSSEEGRRPE